MNSAVDIQAVDKKFKRCAVFKIDLKGRFVYIDDLTEELLHSPRESLFGRNIKAFLTGESYSTLQQVFQRGRHYETSFEAITLDVIDSGGNIRPLGSVITLNFIAGNPANYQIVLIPAHGLADPALSHAGELGDQLFDFILNLNGGINWEELAKIFLSLPDVTQAGIYEYKEQILRLLASSLRSPSTGGEVDLAITNENHQSVARERRHFVTENALPSEGDRARRVELCYPFTHGEDCWGIIRFIGSSGLIVDNDILSQASRFLSNALYSFVISQSK
jgi:hypothetical protein